MLLDPEPHHMVRPLFVGLRGAGFTIVAFLAFFYMTGVTWEQKLAVTRPYLAAVGISFALHYVCRVGSLLHVLLAPLPR